MFDAETLTQIYSDEELKQIPISYQSIIVRVIERVLEEKEAEENGTAVYKS